MIKTPAQAAGPFYPVEFPLDWNNDLARNRLIVALRPADELEPGATMGVFDIVLAHGGHYARV